MSDQPSYLVLDHIEISTIEVFNPELGWAVKRPGATVQARFWRVEGEVPEGYERRELVYYVKKPPAG